MPWVGGGFFLWGARWSAQTLHVTPIPRVHLLQYPLCASSPNCDPRPPDDSNPVEKSGVVRADDRESTPHTHTSCQESSSKCSGDTSETSPAVLSGLRPLSKRSYEGKGWCILRARGQGGTSEFGGAPGITAQMSRCQH